MSKVSIIVPSRNEQFLSQTVATLLKHGGDIEVIAVLDGYWPDPPLPNDKRLVILHRGVAKGLRAADNAGAAIARGEWIMKTDAHCLFAEGFDEALQADCDHDWIVIPRRYSLDAENWTTKEKSPVDYHYLSCPFTNKDGFSMHGVPWKQRDYERYNKPEFDIDENMSFQGSCWFMHKDLWNRIGPMNDAYGTFSQEPQELGNKTWLSGGKVMVNKKTWYAHLHKGKTYGRGYHLSKVDVDMAHQQSAREWMNNLWPKQTRKLEWLIDHFWPVPTWPENWKELKIPDEYQPVFT